MIALRPWLRSALSSTTLLVVAATYGILAALASAAGLFGIPLAVLVLLSLWRYGYSLLRTLAQGHRHCPAPGIETMNPIGEWTLVAHFLLFAGLAWVLAAGDALGGGALAGVLRWPALCVVAFAFPASASIMALTRSLAAAVSPSGIAAVVRGFGVDYAVLLALCAGLAAVTTAASALAVGAFGSLGVLLAHAFVVWQTLAVFAVTGAALRARRDVFEIPGEVRAREEYDAEAALRARTAALDRAYASMRSGLASQGERTLEALIEEERGSYEIHDWLLSRMLAWEDKSPALRLAQRYIERLVADARLRDALEVFKRCRYVTEGFRLPNRTAAALADYARSIGWETVAEQLAPAAQSARMSASRRDRT